MECTIRRKPNWRRERNFVVTFEISKLKPWRRRCPACHHTMGNTGRGKAHVFTRGSNSTTWSEQRLPFGATSWVGEIALSGWAECYVQKHRPRVAGSSDIIYTDP